MIILVLNLGSTSFKFKLFDFSDSENTLIDGVVENIGSPRGTYRVNLPKGTDKGDCICREHDDAVDLCFSILLKSGIIASISDVDVVGYKAVHGGTISGARFVDDDLLYVMDRYASLAPAHNPVYTKTMRAVQAKFPGMKQAAYFETAFHATIPDYRATYGVPYRWQTDFGVRRYGFHGSSHSYIAWKLSELEPSSNKIISMHLGGSSSLCAVNEGRSIAESMGATPQSGIFHNNRVGDFDAFCIPDLIRRYDGDVDEVFRQMAANGGFLGISGVSNDLRAVLQARDEGNARADLAVNAFVDAVVGYIGMFTAYLGGLDALVFTGGIGERSPVIRAMICSQLGWLNADLDDPLNEDAREGRINSDRSKVSIWVLPTNEELMVARQASKLLSDN